MLPLAVLLFLAAPDFSGEFRAGLMALNQNDLPRARQSLETAAKLQPRNPEVWVALAQTYRKLNSEKLADDAAAKAEQLAAKSPATIHALAIFYSQGGKFAKAAALESRYAEANDRAYADAAALWIRANKPKAAIEYAQRALQQEDRADVHALLAAALDADNRFPEALKEYERAIELAPYEETYYFDSAQACLRQQQFAEALGILEKGVKIFDRSAQIQLALGVAYYGARRFDDASAAFLRTIALAPEVEQPYVFLGKMLDQASARMPEIAAKFERWAEANPRNALAQFLYAHVLLASGGDEAAAEKLLRNSIALKEDQWETHYELGVLFEKQHKFTDAAAELERSIAIDPNRADVHYHLARVYDRLGERSKAAEHRAVHEHLVASPGTK